MCSKSRGLLAEIEQFPCRATISRTRIGFGARVRYCHVRPCEYGGPVLTCDPKPSTLNRSTLWFNKVLSVIDLLQVLDSKPHNP